ncbi:MAG: acyltransferase [Aristaeellaceae bacterium]
MQATTASAKPARRFDFDLIRVIACLSVVMVHASGKFATTTVTRSYFWLSNVLDSISRAGVPLFVMLSGALMLDESYVFTRKKWLRHIGNMILFFFVWSIVYYCLFSLPAVLADPDTFRLADMLVTIVQGHYHLWFVPMIIGLYLILPLLRLWVRRENRRYVGYFLLLALVFTFALPQLRDLAVCIVPGVDSLYKLYDKMNLEYLMGYTSYFVLGWYLDQFTDTCPKRLILGLGLAGVCVTIAGTYVYFALELTKEFLFFDNFGVNVLTYAAAIFVLVISRCRHTVYQNRLSHRVIRVISRYSLGIYAMHVFFVSKLSRALIDLPTWQIILIVFLVSVAASTALSALLKRIPLLRRCV